MDVRVGEEYGGTRRRLHAQLAEEVREFWREGSLDGNLPAGSGVPELQAGGVEEVALQFEDIVAIRSAKQAGGSVELVSHDGVAERLEMDADLVGAAGFDLDLDESEGAVGRW